MVKIFVGRLAESVTRDDLQKLFEKYGEVSDCDILRDYGFVHMADENRAQKAIRELDRMELCGSRISVEVSTSRSMKSCQLTVGNLPERTSLADVHKLFKKFGTVTLCRVTGSQAAVHMRWASMAVQAIRNLNGETYKGNVLSVQFATNSTSKEEWSPTSTTPTQPTPNLSSQSGQRFSTSNNVSTANTQSPNTNFPQAWTNFVNNNSTNHGIPNGNVANTGFSTSTHQNSGSNNPNAIPPLMPPNNANHGDNQIPSKNNVIDTSNKQPADSPNHSNLSNSGFEELNKAAEEAKCRMEKRQFIQQGLQFLQSPRPWSGTPEEYTNFLNQIKQLLLQEGKELRKESAYGESVQKLSEAINMCKYMESEGIKGHNANIVTLLVERSSVLLEMGKVPPAMDDANRALQISNGGSQDAVLCKVKGFMKMGSFNEAYDLLMQFSRNNSLDVEAAEILNNLGQILGLRTRKPYQPFGSFNSMPPSPGDPNKGDQQNNFHLKPDVSAPNPINPQIDNFGKSTNNSNLLPFGGSNDSFNPNFTPHSENQNKINPVAMQNFQNRPPQSPQMMQGFNKTPGTSLHGFSQYERQSSAPGHMVNGGMPPQKSPMPPIGPRPIGSRLMPNPYGNFHQPNDQPSIADSLRKNLEIMAGDTPPQSMFGQNARMLMDPSVDLVTGIQKLAVGQQLKENGLPVDMHKNSSDPPPSSKMWDYVSGKCNNNNNAPSGSFSSSLPPIGFRKPFSGSPMSGDPLLSPPSNSPGAPSLLSSSSESHFPIADGFNKMQENPLKGSLLNEIRPPNANQDQGFGISSTGGIMSPSDPIGIMRLSSDPGVFSHSGPSYSHFAPNSGHPTGLSQLFGPSAIGIGIPPTTQQNKPPQQRPITQPTAASVVLSQKTYSEKSEDSLDIINPDDNESLDSYLRNPLHNTHEFKLGCSDCVLKTGSSVVDYQYDENLNHMCYKNILLCRRRDSSDWHKIRPRPQPQSKAQLYDGPYYICKDLLAGTDCTYPVVCTFAYNQEEIDVWTLERKQMLNRRWLFDSLDEDYMRELSVVGRVLCKHRGLLEFLCQACFANKPRIISTFNVTTGMCNNADADHQDSEDNRQLTHILRDTAVRYTAVRVPAQQPILCRHEVRFQCTREEDCHFAHSLVERDVWALMIKKGLTPDQIVEQSREYMKKLNNNINSLDQGISQSSDLGVPMFRWKVKFICSLCYKNGQISEATKDLKYCSARAQHSWATNKKTVLVQTIRKDWTQIRDLPYLKNKALPARFELCENIRKQKKCPFSNKCNFAHSQEELDIWIYLRDNQLKDLEDLHDSLSRDKQAKANSVTKNAAALLGTSDPNAIRLPTDFLPQSAYHCWLCNKECNGQRQWEHHCLSVKHRLGALSDADGNWKYRNPGGNYELCERHLKNACEYDNVAPFENMCRSAHSIEELEEWKQRREYVINRIKKAQNDQLISAADSMDKLLKESRQHQ